MKKILFLCDGDNFSAGAFQLIKLMRADEPLFIKGIFFTPVDFNELIPVSFMPIAQPYVRLKEEEDTLVEKSKQQFADACQSARIKFHIYEKSEGWDRNLFKKESRFADLVVVGSSLFSSEMMEDQPCFFMQEALRETEAPVMIVPDNFEEVQRLAIGYDGKPETIFALKQFIYLFPQLTDLPAEFVYVKAEGSDEIPHKELLEEYASAHFNSLAASKLHFDPKKYFSTWLEEKKNVMLVAGSYSRSMASNVFKPSFVDEVIRNHVSPVFIAHFS
ncbi:MAG TPA: universal stress protein [Puia sp.]|nr:universal stress protein [Puia sp.]